MVNDMSHLVTNLREDARRPDGRFGEYPLSEVDIDLTALPHGEHEAYTGWSAAIRRAFQARTLRGVTPSPRTALSSRRWHDRLLDQMVRHTAPAAPYGLKGALKRAVTRGGLACAAVLCAVVPFQYGQQQHDHDVDAVVSASGWADHRTDLASEYDCSDSGLPQGVDAVHALVLDKTTETEPAMKIVSFDRGREIYEAGREDLVLVAVCSE